MPKMPRAASLALGLVVSLLASTSARAQPVLLSSDGYPSYCDRLYHGTPASTPSYFYVAPGVAIGRHLTHHPVYGWCGYPFDPRYEAHRTGFSFPHLALRHGRGFRRD